MSSGPTQAAAPSKRTSALWLALFVPVLVVTSWLGFWISDSDVDGGRLPANVEYRWENGPYSPYTGARMTRPRDAREVTFRATPLPYNDVSPSISAPRWLPLLRASEGERPLRIGITGVLALETGTSPVELTFHANRDSIGLFEFRFGRSDELTELTLREYLPTLVVGATLTFVGLALIVLGAVRKYARPHVWLGLFTLALGILQVALSAALRGLVLGDHDTWNTIANVASLLYPAALGLFVERLFAPAGDRPLRLFANVMLAAIPTALVLSAAGVASLDVTRRYAFYMVFFGIVRIVMVIVPKALRGDRLAQMFLGGFGLMVAFGLPDILSIMALWSGRLVVGHFAVLVFVGSLVLILERNVRRQRDDLEGARVELEKQVEDLDERARQIGALNEELRHQVAERSRELAELIQGAELRVAELVPGDVVASRYRVVRQLGLGGMGAVYEVSRTNDGKRLALKVLLRASTPEEAARFAREGEIAARLSHENLVGVVDAGLDRGRLYLVMELVDGPTLEVHRSRFGDVEWARPLLAQVARGLSALHDRGVQHRDLKPANVLIARDGERTIVKISDFGISSRPGLDALGATIPSADSTEPVVKGALTAPGSVFGTPHYMPPEAARGSGELSSSADVFAFGVMAFEMLVGTPPFRLPPLIDAIAGRPFAAAPVPEGLAKTNPALAELLGACLAENPESRPNARWLESVLRAA